MSFTPKAQLQGQIEDSQQLGLRPVDISNVVEARNEMRWLPGWKMR